MGSHVRLFEKSLKIKVLTLSIFFLGLLLRSYKIGKHGFDLDEMISLDFALSEGGWGFLADTNPPLYLLFLKLWLGVVGAEALEFWTRLLSVLFSQLTLAVLLFVGFKKIGERSWWWLPGLLYSIHPLSVELSRQARLFTLAEFFVALLILIWSLDDKGKTKTILAMACGLCSHLLFVWIAGVYAVLTSVRRHWLWLTLMAATSGLGSMAILKFTSAELDWQKHRYMAAPLWKEISDTMGALSWGGLYILLGLLLLFYRERNSESRQGLMFFAKWICWYLGMLLLVSVINERSLFLPRYVFLVLPLLCVWAGLLLKKHFISYVLLVVILATSAIELHRLYNKAPAGWKAAFQFVSHHNIKEVYTSRSLSMRTPYLNAKQISVHKLDFLGEGLQPLLEGAENPGGVFVVDNYWGALLYWEELKATLTKRNYLLNEKTFTSADGDVVRTLQIRKGPLSL